ncbi:MAG: FkbM family methyltransferase, partial [Planctomycetes bacterium]|nr:FkbM family methyltransferase [Planctomycetota bacterium]
IVKDDATKKHESVKIPTITIDSKFCGVSQAISLIKCDVEGHELACIKGAQELLARYQPIWLIEVSDDPDNSESSAHILFQQLAKNGYSAWWFDGTTLRKRGVGDKSINYFFLKDNHIGILKERAPKLLSIPT